MSSSPSDTCQHSHHRNRSLKLAVMTSLISKMGTSLLRLVSIPIALRLLGIEMFGVYAAITMVVGMIDMLFVGVGPALVKEISKALANNDREREKTVFATSMLLNIGLAVVTSLVTLLVLLVVPIPDLFGDKFGAVGEEMKRAALLGLAIIAVDMVVVAFEMARDGYQETRYTNSWGAFGNILAAVTLLSGIWFFPTIEFLLLAINGSVVLAKTCNAIQLLKQRPYLIPRFTNFRRHLVKPIALSSGRFSITYILAAAVEFNAMAFFIGHFAGPKSVGVYNIMITLHISLMGILHMVTRPYWPAVMDAYERNDLGWIKKTSSWLRLGGLGFATVAGLGLVTLGPTLLPLWGSDELYAEVKPGFQLGYMALAGYSLYFVMYVWRHINQVLALGVGEVSNVAWVVVMEAIVVLTGSTLVLMHTRSIGAIYTSMAFIILLLSGWIFPRLFAKTCRTMSLSQSVSLPPRADHSPASRELQSEQSLPVSASSSSV